MRNISIFYLLILFASALVPVSGNPVGLNISNACTGIVQRVDASLANLNPSAEATIKYIQTHNADVNKLAVTFYSGSTVIGGKTVRAFEKISDFKKIQPNIHILENIIVDAKQDSSAWDHNDWTAVSKALADAAHSPVFVLLGKEVLPTSVFIMTEQPALIANRDVTKPLTIYEIQTDGAIRIKTNSKLLVDQEKSAYFDFDLRRLVLSVKNNLLAL